jgi:bla regulator protein BlaR1
LRLFSSRPKLRPHDEGPACDTVVPVERGKVPSVFPAECDSNALMPTTGHMMMMGSRHTTMELLAPMLSNVGRVGRPVVDRTGLSGRFDYTVEFVPESNSAASADANGTDASAGPTFLEAIREQLGLKLEPTVAPIEVLVVDHVERPSEN